MAWLTCKRWDSTIYGGATVLLPLFLIMFLSSGVASTDHLMSGGMVAPQGGPIVLFVSQAGPIAHSLLPHRTETGIYLTADQKVAAQTYGHRQRPPESGRREKTTRTARLRQP